LTCSATPSRTGRARSTSGTVIATVASLRALLEPKAMAVIGTRATAQISADGSSMRSRAMIPRRGHAVNGQLRRNRRPALLPGGAESASRRGPRHRRGADRRSSGRGRRVRGRLACARSS
jgi:hypothetical protein